MQFVMLGLEQLEDDDAADGWSEQLASLNWRCKDSCAAFPGCERAKAI